MGWRRRSPAAARAAGGGDGDVLAGAEGRNEHDSPALAEIFAAVDEDRPVRVLDLGPALRPNLEFYSAIASGVRIAHLVRDEDLEKLRNSEDDPFVSILERLSPTDDEPFDLVLVWDLLNYLVRGQPAILAHHLAAVAKRGARIHAMVFTTETMPAQPSGYEIGASGRLIYRPTTRARIEAPNPPAAQVERWLDPFRITRSFVLRHGVREFLGTFD
jgi:hypothetical protein